MTFRALRNPEERGGTLGNTALPPPDRNPASTEALLHRALVRGDDEALERIVRRLRPEMLRLATRHVRSVDEAEDVVQDTWIAALTAIKRFEGRASLRTWLIRILIYRALSAGRRNGRIVPISHVTGASGTAPEPPSSVPFLATPPPGPEEAVLAQDLRDRVEEALVTLPDRQREVVRLRDLEGWSPNEVSARLRVSAGNQRVLLHRGRLQLREIVAI